MVELCANLWEWSVSCEWSNLQTMIIELGIASGIAGWLFKRQQKISREQKKISQSLLSERLKKFYVLWIGNKDSRNIRIVDAMEKIQVLQRNKESTDHIQDVIHNFYRIRLFKLWDDFVESGLIANLDLKDKKIIDQVNANIVKHRTNMAMEIAIIKEDEYEEHILPKIRKIEDSISEINQNLEKLKKIPWIKSSV